MQLSYRLLFLLVCPTSSPLCTCGGEIPARDAAIWQGGRHLWECGTTQEPPLTRMNQHVLKIEERVKSIKRRPHPFQINASDKISGNLIDLIQILADFSLCRSRITLRIMLHTCPPSRNSGCVAIPSRLASPHWARCSLSSRHLLNW